jgi:membrane associated rhomboid family serine protease
MEHKEDEIAQLRLLAGKLSADWRGSEFMAPALARRIRDFQFAQEKRRKKYGDERPWGILGLYDHLSAIRIDVEWAEDAAWRRANGESYESWADFDESKKGGSNRPIFTYFILTVCTLVMIASISMNGWKVEPVSDNPMIGPSAETLIKMGAKETKAIVEENEGWRLLTSTVLHAGLVHYLINMLALWFVGGAIEMSHGWFAAATIFTLSAVGGAIMSAIFLPEYITVGASGGIFGFIGACIADIIVNWKLLFCDFVTENGKKHRHILVVVVLILDIALNSIIGLTPYVDNFTHLGGMAYGFLCGLSTMERLSMDFFGMEEGWMIRAKQLVVRFSGLILSVVALVTTLILLLNMDPSSSPCPDCTWLSCVPFPPWESDATKWWYCDDCATVRAEIVQRPYRHLELDCPGGFLANVNITLEESRDRKSLQKNLPTYCRAYCPTTEEL